MKWFQRKYIIIAVLLCVPFVFFSHDFNLWCYGLDSIPMPKISFEAQYDFEEPNGHKIIKTVYCNGKDLIAMDDPRFKLIENYASRTKSVVDRNHRIYYAIDFLGQPPISIDLYQPAFVKRWQNIPLGDKEIDGLLCSGFQQKGLHSQSPFDKFFNGIGMRLEPIEDPATAAKKAELYKHWFAKDTGLLVKGAGYTLKSLSLKMSESRHFEIPPGCIKAPLP